MDLHSVIVRILQLALPLVAIVILVFAFAFDWSDEQEIAEKFQDDDKEFAEIYGQVDNPSIEATVSNGDKLVVTAKEAKKVSENFDQIDASDIQGEIASGGSFWDIQSDNGETDEAGKFAKFRGNVAAIVDERYHIIGSIIEANMVERIFSSDEPIKITSDRFDISADKGELTGERGKRVVVFEGHVKGVIRLENW